jgi:hypothetical protein
VQTVDRFWAREASSSSSVLLMIALVVVRYSRSRRADENNSSTGTGTMDIDDTAAGGPHRNCYTLFTSKSSGNHQTKEKTNKPPQA